LGSRKIGERRRDCARAEGRQQFAARNH